MIYIYELYVATSFRRGFLLHDSIGIFINRTSDFWEYTVLSSKKEGPFYFKSEYSPKLLKEIEDPQILMIYLSYVAEEIMSQYPELKIEVNYEGISKEFV